MNGQIAVCCVSQPGGGGGGGGGGAGVCVGMECLCTYALLWP